MKIEPNWVVLDGVVNMRDLGGRTTSDGHQMRDGVVLRSDNLQDLPRASVRILLNDYGLSDIVDLRTNRERRLSGPTPLNGNVREHDLSLYPEDDPDSPVPPWAADLSTFDSNVPLDRARGMARHYLGYLKVRPDSILGALRVIADARGATVINCAAGKDRTGTASAVLLLILGVPADQVIADYAASNEKVPAILERLGSAATAGSAEHDAQVAAQSTPPQVMELLVESIQDELGGIETWAASNGWTDADQERLTSRLLV